MNQSAPLNAAQYDDAYDWLVDSLQLVERKRAFYCGETELRLRLVEDLQGLLIEEIQVTPTGTGLGSAVVQQLIDYAATNGKAVEVYDNRNEQFWSHWSEISFS